MRHAAGQLDEGLDASQGLCEGEDLGKAAEALSSVVSTADAEGKHAASHAVTVLLASNVAVGVGVQPRVVDGDDMW